MTKLTLRYARYALSALGAVAFGMSLNYSAGVGRQSDRAGPGGTRCADQTTSESTVGSTPDRRTHVTRLILRYARYALSYLNAVAYWITFN